MYQNCTTAKKLLFLGILNIFYRKIQSICNRMVYKQMRNGKAIAVKTLLQKNFFTFSGEPRKIFPARQKVGKFSWPCQKFF